MDWACSKCGAVGEVHKGVWWEDLIARDLPAN